MINLSELLPKLIPFTQECSDQVLSNSVFLVATIVAAIFQSPVFSPLGFAVGIQALSVVAIQFTMPEKGSSIYTIQLNALCIHENYPVLQGVALLVVAVTFFISPLLSYFLGAIAGIYLALISSAAQQQVADLEKENELGAYNV
jgi:hypothetical protein